MSAWMCSDKHIVFLVEVVCNSIRSFEKSAMDGLSRRDLAQILIDENAASLEARYGDTDNAHTLSELDYAGLAEDVRLDPVLGTAQYTDWWKAAESYDYQACEHPQYRSSVAYHWINVMKASIASEALSWDSANHAFWGID